MVWTVLGDGVGFMVLFCAFAEGERGTGVCGPFYFFFRNLWMELTFSDIKVLLVFGFKGKPTQMPSFFFWQDLF